MANKKISELNAATDLSGAELAAIQGGETKRLPASLLAPTERVLAVERGGVVLPWTASTTYKAGQAMIQAGVTYTRNSDGTSRSSFDATEAALWTALPFPRGVELGYAEITSSVNFTTVAASWEDVAGLAVTVDVGTRPIIVTFTTGRLYNGTAARSDIGLREGSNELQIAQFTSTAANAGSPLTVRARLSPSAGSHTYKVSGRVSVASTATVQAGTINPASVQVVEC